jgi:hypothetical protein
MISVSRKCSGIAALALLAVVTAPARADDTPTFYKDQRTGCNVGTLAPEPGLSVRWSGPCRSGLAEGSGTVEWLKNGVSTGHSDGAYHLGLREGQFVFTNPDGSTSVGAYHNGQQVAIFYVDPASHCSLGTFSNDAQLSVHWSGTCAAGKAEGQGIAEWQKAGNFASRTEATFHAGLPEGRGMKQTSDDYRYEAEFRNGRMNGRCVVTTPKVRIDGQCANDLLNGPGTAVFVGAGGRYEGDFRDSKLTGKGVWVFASGSRLEGDFLDAKLHGKGRAIYPNGDSYEGDYVNGNYEGQGIFHDHEGSVYEGEWAHDLPNGRGVLHGITHGLLMSGTHDFSGTWVEGCFRQGEYTATFATTRAKCGFND